MEKLGPHLRLPRRRPDGLGAALRRLDPVRRRAAGSVPAGELNGPGADLVGRERQGSTWWPSPTGRAAHRGDRAATGDDLRRHRPGAHRRRLEPRRAQADVITRSASTGRPAGCGARQRRRRVRRAGAGRRPASASVADLRAVGDVNGDGIPDLAGTPSGKSAARLPGQRHRRLRRAPTSAKGPEEPRPARSPQTLRLACCRIGDVDGNGRSDVLVRAADAPAPCGCCPASRAASTSGSTSPRGFGGFDLAG